MRRAIAATWCASASATVYLDIVHKLAADRGISMDEGKLDLAAERFATRRGGRSARGARQFVDSLLATPDTLN